jgi:hypothetical protein
MASIELGHTRLIVLAASSASGLIMAAALFAAALILQDVHSLQEEILSGTEQFKASSHSVLLRETMTIGDRTWPTWPGIA